MRDDQAAIGAVVERALHPLYGGGRRGAGLKAENKAGQAADALGPHRISFVSHRRTADLVGFERLFDLFARRQESQVRRHFVRRLSNSGEQIDNLRINFAAVGLACNGIAVFKTEFLSDEAFELADLGMVAVKQV